MKKVKIVRVHPNDDYYFDELEGKTGDLVSEHEGVIAGWKIAAVNLDGEIIPFRAVKLEVL